MSANGSYRLERLWPLLRDIGAFLLGIFILVEQTVFESSAQTILVVVAVACLGVTGSGAAQRVLKSKLESLGESEKKEK